MESMPPQYATKLTGTPVAGTVTTQDNLLRRVAGLVVTVVMDESGHSLGVGAGGLGEKGRGTQGSSNQMHQPQESSSSEKHNSEITAVDACLSTWFTLQLGNVHF